MVLENETALKLGYVIMQHFKNCCGKELWDGILSFPSVNNGQVYRTLKEKREVELKHLSFAFGKCDQLLSWLPFRYFSGSFTQAELGVGKFFFG